MKHDDGIAVVCLNLAQRSRNCGGVGRSSSAVRLIPAQIHPFIRIESWSGAGISDHLSSIVGVRRVTNGAFQFRKKVLFATFSFEEKVEIRS